MTGVSYRSVPLVVDIFACAFDRRCRWQQTHIVRIRQIKRIEMHSSIVSISEESESPSWVSSDVTTSTVGMVRSSFQPSVLNADVLHIRIAVMISTLLLHCGDAANVSNASARVRAPLSSIET